MNSLLVYQALEEAAKKWPHSPAVYDEYGMMTFEELYKETEDLFDRSVLTKEICELRNIINTGYLVIKMAMQRKESRGLHYTLDYPHKIES